MRRNILHAGKAVTEHLKGALGGIISPQPSLFDVIVCGLLYITIIRDPYIQGMFFVFYSIFLICFSLALKQKREFISIPLVLLVIWSLASSLIHNEMNILPNAIMNHYFNTAIMFEGFIYLFCGAFLLHAIVRYSTNIKLFFVVLFVLLVFCNIPIVTHYFYGGRVTPIMALIISVVVYFIIKKRYMLSISLISIGSVFTILKWSWISQKFICRPYVWTELSRQILEHPFIGTGYNHTLFPDNMVWVRKIGTIIYGWIYRHNDFLSIGAYLGIFASICAVWFSIETLVRVCKTIYIIPVLAIVITCFFQMTMFEPIKAAICIITISVAIAEAKKERLCVR